MKLNKNDTYNILYCFHFLQNIWANTSSLQILKHSDHNLDYYIMNLQVECQQMQAQQL